MANIQEHIPKPDLRRHTFNLMWDPTCRESLTAQLMLEAVETDTASPELEAQYAYQEGRYLIPSRIAKPVMSAMFPGGNRYRDTRHRQYLQPTNQLDDLRMLESFEQDKLGSSPRERCMGPYGFIREGTYLSDDVSAAVDLSSSELDKILSLDPDKTLMARSGRYIFRIRSLPDFEDIGGFLTLSDIEALNSVGVATFEGVLRAYSYGFNRSS